VVEKTNPRASSASGRHLDRHQLLTRPYPTLSSIPNGFTKLSRCCSSSLNFHLLLDWLQTLGLIP
jgi:hypothetical protein